MQDHNYFVYLLASARYGTLYVGVTNDLIRRAIEHRDGLVPGFTKRHSVKLLVYFEQHGSVEEAIAREKTVKRWRRDWKISMIERDNPHWQDLLPGLTGSRVCGAPLTAAPRPG
jgi:putative endonuclease